jgi:hypothetical protein
MGEKWGALDSSIFFSLMVETREEQRIMLEFLCSLTRTGAASLFADDFVDALNIVFIVFSLEDKALNLLVFAFEGINNGTSSLQYLCPAT